MNEYCQLVRTARLTGVRGRVTELTGLLIKATVPGIHIGDRVDIVTSEHELPAEVVGFRGLEALLMPLGIAKGIGTDSEVIPTGRPFTVQCGQALLGHILNGLGEPIDRPFAPNANLTAWAVERPPPDPLERERIEHHLSFGIRAIDGLLTVGRGQRLGLFAGSGVGKSTLMGQIVRSSEADIVVCCLIGERGREVQEFVEESLGTVGLNKSVVVCATSDEPALVRKKSAIVATAIAEWFRLQGAHVLLLMDSITRFARAQREIGLALGEPPTRQGYPPSVFSELPRLLERGGNTSQGSITALYTVLVAGADMDEPIADEVRGILDGHIILSRDLSAHNHWPAIDIQPSLSRIMNRMVSPEHKAAAQRLRKVLSTYMRQRDLILLGAYQYGSDPETDYAIDKIDAVDTFLKQELYEHTPFSVCVEYLISLFH
ncbi:MAG: FliI/YscN family ATPase [Myxococcales bacterium]|nr:FliI/YscN family ATPase [Myxococcales bacterium]